MSNLTGGVAAAFGFRYQYLITVKVLLDLYECSGRQDWAVDVDLASQDSADIIVYKSGQNASTVIQVKASLPTSSTTIGLPKVREIFASLKKEHPNVHMYELVTNRELTKELEKKIHGTSNTFFPNEKFSRTNDSLLTLANALLQQIMRLRGIGEGGTGHDLYYILLRELVDRVHEAGSNDIDQRITFETVSGILEGKNSTLANILGFRSWGNCIHVPTGNYIERNRASNFLNKELPLLELFSGTPKKAVIKGISGTGKTAAAVNFVHSRIEQVAFAIWLNAASPEALDAQIFPVLEKLGSEIPPKYPSATSLTSVLSELPVPWLLVLDNAQTAEEIDSWIPCSGYGQVLITSNQASWPSDFCPVLNLDQFNDDEVLDFFATRLERPTQEWTHEQIVACNNIARHLSRWPLALEISVAWIIQNGGSPENLYKFMERIERLDLNDTVLTPHGYPKTATQTIVKLLEGLSPDALQLVYITLLLGGDYVPKKLLIDWGLEAGLQIDNALKEVLQASICSQNIVESQRPHDYDETVTIHDFLKLVMEGKPISLSGVALDKIVRLCESVIPELITKAKFLEAASLISPVNHLLIELEMRYRDNPKMMIRLSVLMHNLGQIALLSSNISVACHWLKRALDVRSNVKPPNKTLFASMQLQTLAIYAQALIYQESRYDKLKYVSDYSNRLLKQGAIFKDESTVKAIGVIYQVLRNYLPSETVTLSSLEKFISNISINEMSIGTPGEVTLMEIQSEMQRAIVLVDHDDWEQGVNIGLAAANRALEEGILLETIVEKMLDIGIGLIIAGLQRQHDFPEKVFDCLNRVACWFNDNIDDVNESQQERLLLLKAISTKDPNSMRSALREIPEAKKSGKMIGSWCDVTKGVIEQLDRILRRELFSKPPEGVSVTFSTDGGNSINYWTGIRRSDEQGLKDIPVLFVCTSSLIQFDSKGENDPLKEAFIKAGLPESYLNGQLEVAADWSAIIQDRSITITDSSDMPLVRIDDLDADFSGAVSESGNLLLIYGDPALIPNHNQLLPRGLVKLVKDDVEIKGEITHGSSSMAFRPKVWKRVCESIMNKIRHI